MWRSDRKTSRTGTTDMIEGTQAEVGGSNVMCVWIGFVVKKNRNGYKRG